MDPLTLFTLASGAVSAVKKGCQLYKDIKSAAGDIKAVLTDLDNQFNHQHKDKPATVEQRNQYVQERNRVVELNKRDGETTGIYQEIGEHLGAYYDNFHKCMAIFAEEERRSKTEVYSGDASLGKRALQRVLMRKQLQQMEVELRELMIYQSPPELGALYTEVEEMMKQMGKEQTALVVKQMQRQERDAQRRAAIRQKLNIQFMWGICLLVIIFTFFFMMLWVVHTRQQMYPQYGNELMPKTQKQRDEDALPTIYIGR
jgi:hypothetical protein